MTDYSRCSIAPTASFSMCHLHGQLLCGIQSLSQGGLSSALAGAAVEGQNSRGFTNSASQSGEKLSTLLQLMVFAMQMSMIWVGGGDNWSGGSRTDQRRGRRARYRRYRHGGTLRMAHRPDYSALRGWNVIRRRAAQGAGVPPAESQAKRIA